MNILHIRNLQGEEVLQINDAPKKSVRSSGTTALPIDILAVGFGSKKVILYGGHCV